MAIWIVYELTRINLLLLLVSAGISLNTALRLRHKRILLKKHQLPTGLSSLIALQRRRDKWRYCCGYLALLSGVMFAIPGVFIAKISFPYAAVITALLSAFFLSIFFKRAPVGSEFLGVMAALLALGMYGL